VGCVPGLGFLSCDRWGVGIRKCVIRTFNFFSSSVVFWVAPTQARIETPRWKSGYATWRCAFENSCCTSVSWPSRIRRHDEVKGLRERLGEDRGDQCVSSADWVRVKRSERSRGAADGIRRPKSAVFTCRNQERFYLVWASLRALAVVKEIAVKEVAAATSEAHPRAADACVRE